MKKSNTFNVIIIVLLCVIILMISALAVMVCNLWNKVYDKNPIITTTEPTVTTSPSNNSTPVTLEPGLYDANDNLLASWKELVVDYYICIEMNHTSTSKSGLACYVLDKYIIFSSAVKLVIGDTPVIGAYALKDCNHLKSIVIPNGVSKIGNGAFKNCFSLQNITFEGTVAEWEAIDKNVIWNIDIPATEVKCSDGTVKIK